MTSPYLLKMPTSSNTLTILKLWFLEKKYCLPEFIDKLERTLSSLDTWFHFNGLKVNTSKTELILFGSRQNCRGLDPVSIRFRDDMVLENPTVKNLGVLFDKHVTWDAHVSALVKKCYGILIGLSHVRHCIPPDLLPQLVNALVISHVRYCLTVFGNGSQLNMDRLDKILNFAMRVISGKRKFEHITPVRTELGWPTASQMYRQQSLNSLHKIRCTGEPQALASQLVLNSQIRSRLTRQDPDLSLPRTNTDYGERRLLVHTVQLYNSLPRAMHNMTLSTFKRDIRTLYA